MFSFMAYGNLATLAPNVWRVNSQVSHDATFVHYPFFIWNVPLFSLFIKLSLSGIFFRYLFVLRYFDSSQRNTHTTIHQTGTQISSRQNDAKYCRGNKSSFRSLAHFCRRKHKKTYHSHQSHS